MSDRARLDLDVARLRSSSSLPLRARDLDLARELPPSSPLAFRVRDLDRADDLPDTLGSRGALLLSSASLALSLGSRLLLRPFLTSLPSGPRDLLLVDLPLLLDLPLFADLADLRLETLRARLLADLRLDTDLDRTGVCARTSATGGPSALSSSSASRGAPDGPGSPPPRARLLDLPWSLLCFISAS